MTSEIEMAFAHPSARSEAMSPDVLDRISVRDHVVHVEIGAFQAERGTTQRVRFNVVVEVYPLADDAADDVDRILSYDCVTEAITAQLADGRLNLLETLAENIADQILVQPQAARVFVRIEKLDRGPGNLGVEIMRSRADAGQIGTALTVQPIVMFVPFGTMHNSDLGAWLDHFDVSQTPVILVTEAAPDQSPQCGDTLLQRRIDLLSIDQSACVLAAYDPRIQVVGSLTELDWGLKNHQISVWAPSKIVADVIEGAPERITDPMDMVQWFAKRLTASAVWGLGTPQQSDGAYEVNWLTEPPTDH
ncbi:dihydroneopterin aldolase [Algirhabdus cladophorae]|uniref:dihydroneopterin aldolase n=1 Tax=Algirhabdus cladophorae TaxID=3377108 RepID=UPI003B846BC3